MWSSALKKLAGGAMSDSAINNSVAKLTARERAAFNCGFNYGMISGIVLGGGLGIIAFLWRFYG